MSSPARCGRAIRRCWRLQRQVEALLQEVVEACQAGACKLLGLGCFAAGTTLWTPDGYRAVETLKPGDRVYSRSEHDADAPLAVREVEEVFTRFAAVLELTVAGGVVRTTGEHPFWADRAERGLGWARACELVAGDRLRAASGEWLAVEAVAQTESWEAVYNCRVAEDHTYFVGRAEWGFTLWAHNAYDLVQRGRFKTSAIQLIPTLPKEGRPKNPEQWVKDHWNTYGRMHETPSKEVKFAFGVANSLARASATEAQIRGLIEVICGFPAGIRSRGGHEYGLTLGALPRG